jgi:phosphoribosyl 1,2-cyclic phosphodiesterase
MQAHLFAPTPPPQPPLPGFGDPQAVVSSASVVVLASSSGGNCSALILKDAAGAAVGLILIDLGVTPRRAKRLLGAAGLEVRAKEGGMGLPVVAAVVTHLDSDHLCPSWCQNTREAVALLPPDVPLYMHRRHAGRADRQGLLYRRTIPFTDGFTPAAGVEVRAHIAPHDELGSASFRFVIERKNLRAGHLGWATDVGRPTDELARHLAGVDVLAVESNYCPVMERESDRPEFLKRRVMGGAGHLSNQQSVELTRRVGPKKHVVLLHLSRQCNTPELAAIEHAGAPYDTTVAMPDMPTARIPIE